MNIHIYEQRPVDIAIVGGGPAGLSAGINAVARGRTCLILSSEISDNPLYKATLVENMPGFPTVSGAKLLEAFTDHAKKLSIPIQRGKVLSIFPFDLKDEKENDYSGFQIAFGNQFFLAKSIILATGSSSPSSFLGEDTYLGRGVSYCATCDGMFFKGKDVAVIAQAEDSFEEAEHLSRIGCRVLLFVKKSDVGKEKINKSLYHEVIPAQKYQIEGDGRVVTGLVADGKNYPVSGIFILRPVISLSKLLLDLELKDGHIVTGANQETNIPGVFAAGDCTGKPFQIAPALGEGLIAALSADAYLSKNLT